MTASVTYPDAVEKRTRVSYHQVAGASHQGADQATHHG
jgi:hypothetical protein